MWVGPGLLQGITDQHVQGYPGLSQIIYLAVVPAVFWALTAVHLLLWLVLRLSGPKWLRSLGWMVVTLSLLAVPPYVMMYGGGV